MKIETNLQNAYHSQVNFNVPPVDQITLTGLTERSRKGDLLDIKK